MKGSGRIQLTALLTIVLLVAAVLPVYSFDRPEEYIDEMSGECIGTETFTINADDTDYAVLTVKGMGADGYIDHTIAQPNIEGYKEGTHTQRFSCNGTITGIDVCVLVPVEPSQCIHLTPNEGVTDESSEALTVPLVPSPPSVGIRVVDPNDTVLYQSQQPVEGTGRPQWISFDVPHLDLHGSYTLELTGAQWYYGTGYSEGRSDFDETKDFCFKVHYMEAATLYPKTVQYTTDLMGSYELAATDLQNGTTTVTVPKKYINGASSLSLTSENPAQSVVSPVPLRLSWSVQMFHTVPETPAYLSLPVTTVTDDMQFQIQYTDLNNDPPITAKVYINNTPHELENIDTDPYQWNGSWYSLTLPYEECEYYFVVENEKEILRMPEEGSFTIGPLEKRTYDWKCNLEDESHLVDQELDLIDRYYLQNEGNATTLTDLFTTKLALLRSSAQNHHYMDEIYRDASKRQGIQAFENLTDVEIDEAFTELEHGFPEEVQQIFRDYGLSDTEIEELRTAVLNNKATIKEKRILQHFIDLKTVYKEMGLLHVTSASFTFSVYTREGNFTPQTGPDITEAMDSVQTSWEAVTVNNLDRTEIETILQQSTYLVEHGYIAYNDDVSAALVYLYLSIAEDEEFTQELYTNSEYITSPEWEEPTWQDAFNYAWTVRHQTINDIDTTVVNSQRSCGGTVSLPYLPLTSPEFRAEGYCGNGYCEPGYGETPENCPPDCWPPCGNGACEADEDCGSCPEDCGCDRYDGYLGDPYCKNGDVYQTYIDYSCVNGDCVSTEIERKRQECSHGCENGGCIVEPNCDQYDGYVGDPYCKNGNVYQTYRDYYYDYTTHDCEYTETEKQRDTCEHGCENGACIVDDPCDGVTCPEDSYVGDPYCKNGDVYQTYRDWYCVNGECEYIEEERLKEWCENGCWEGCCDPCPCSHDPEVQTLVAKLEEHLEYQEEWTTELAIANEEYNKWKDEADKQWETIKHQYEIWNWNIVDGAVTGWGAFKKWITTGGGRSVAKSLGARIGATVYSAGLWFTGERAVATTKECTIGYSILHNLQSAESKCEFLKTTIEWNGEKISEITGGIKERCPCALE